MDHYSKIHQVGQLADCTPLLVTNIGCSADQDEPVMSILIYKEALD